MVVFDVKFHFTFDLFLIFDFILLHSVVAKNGPLSICSMFIPPPALSQKNKQASDWIGVR